MSMFENPSGGGGSGLYIRHLLGRVCVFEVTGYDPNAMMGTEVKPSVTYNALVIDGGPMVFGGDIPKGIPDYRSVATPYYATGVMSSNLNIVRELAPRAGTGRLTIGRVVRGNGTKGQPPFNIEKMDLVADAEVIRLAETVWTQLKTGTFVNPVPVGELPGAPPAGTLASAYGAATPPQSYPQLAAPVLAGASAAAPQLALPVPAAVVPQAAPVASPFAPAVGRPDNIPETLWATLDPATQLALGVPAAAVASPPCPPSVSPEVWATLDDATKRGLAAAHGGTY